MSRSAARARSSTWPSWPAPPGARPRQRRGRGAPLDVEGLAGVIDVLVACESVEDRMAVPGLDPKRADIVIGGALVLEQAFAFLGIDDMVVSDFAPREGDLLD